MNAIFSQAKQPALQAPSRSPQTDHTSGRMQETASSSRFDLGLLLRLKVSSVVGGLLLFTYDVCLARSRKAGTAFLYIFVLGLVRALLFMSFS